MSVLEEALLGFVQAFGLAQPAKQQPTRPVNAKER
jgi:hypothetical protein